MVKREGVGAGVDPVNAGEVAPNGTRVAVVVVLRLENQSATVSQR